MRNLVKGPSDVDCKGANGAAGFHAGQPLMTLVGEEVSRTESGAKTKLMLGEKALLLQVVHKGGVDHFLQYLWYDAQERYGSVVSHGWAGLLFMNRHDVCCFPQRWIDTLPEAGRKTGWTGVRTVQQHRSSSPAPGRRRGLSRITAFLPEPLGRSNWAMVISWLPSKREPVRFLVSFFSNFKNTNRVMCFIPLIIKKPQTIGVKEQKILMFLCLELLTEWGNSTWIFLLCWKTKLSYQQTVQRQGTRLIKSLNVKINEIMIRTCWHIHQKKYTYLHGRPQKMTAGDANCEKPWKVLTERYAQRVCHGNHEKRLKHKKISMEFVGMNKEKEESSLKVSILQTIGERDICARKILNVCMAVFCCYSGACSKEDVDA